MKEHVGTFSTVTEEAIQMHEGSNDIGIPKENVAARDRARQEPSAPQRSYLWRSRRGNGRGNHRSRNEMLQSKQ